METIYRVGGKEFKELKEATKYENEKEVARKEQERLRKEKEARLQELEDAYMNYTRLIQKYNKDYGSGCFCSVTPTTKDFNDDLVENILKMFNI